ncbi:MAG: pilus assembly protein [Bdellovibrionales bacterium RIFOXYC1_FULL_54_43]|nr:MAG: pilus assembly protein [Bdellovibrionales bacterium RIFOXYC1_FULL_54_43]OFZ80379.1 MAG: pilus assembly protein [Bdellovibrionales bacterium RIFOXYD1_FULL_55_31]
MGVYNESVGVFLAPIQAFLEDDSVSEILINGPDEVFVERRGVLERTDAKFHDEQALQAAVRNIAQFVSRRIDDDNPTLDARLPDGSRVSAVFPPCSRRGTSVSIRKFAKGVPTFVDLINRGSISKEAARFLDVCVYLSKNIIVSGGTGAGKTTLLNVLGSRIPKNQRLLIIEDSSELKVHTDHMVLFETKPADATGKGEVSVRELLRAALRLRPDRIVVGEVRGPEALDLVTAMNTGHGGSMGTTHANSPYDSLVRVETLAMMGETQVPVMAIRRQIASAIHIVVQIKRMPDGSRRVTHITEVMPEVDEHGRYQIQDIYRFIQRGRTPEGQIIGEMVAIGNLPSFMGEIEMNRLPFGREKFLAPEWYRQLVEMNKNAA